MWEKGRQGSGYYKRKLFKFMNVDAYLLKYPVGSSVPMHVDPVQERKHYRLNIVLKPASAGGYFSGKAIFKLGSRVILFRPDKELHSVSKIYKGTRYVLSFGIGIKRHGK